ncbi:hypothetical protein PR048_025798 [Dryococelus australis]|uniref:Uncharacterized protein n=1 Tax=Dryococelus australis TaxID=614101 RepID=A0ABQ9GJG6_9NEOP|nr:hypothetical protein PR048_025798 [Dryococelus australis]
MLINSLIASTCKALNWRAVMLSITCLYDTFSEDPAILLHYNENSLTDVPRSLLPPYCWRVWLGGIVPVDAAGRRVSSSISRFPRPCVSALIHSRLTPPSSALETSMFTYILYMNRDPEISWINTSAFDPHKNPSVNSKTRERPAICRSHSARPLPRCCRFNGAGRSYPTTAVVPRNSAILEHAAIDWFPTGPRRQPRFLRSCLPLVEPRVFHGLSWQQVRLGSHRYTRDNVVCSLVAVIKWSLRTGLLNTRSHYCFLLTTGSQLNGACLTNCRPITTVREKSNCLESTSPPNEFAKYSSVAPSHSRAVVAELLARSSPTKANRAQSPDESPHFRMWESCRKMPLVGGFSQGYPLHPSFRAPLNIHFNHPHRL